MAPVPPQPKVTHDQKVEKVLKKYKDVESNIHEYAPLGAAWIFLRVRTDGNMWIDPVKHPVVHLQPAAGTLVEKLYLTRQKAIADALVKRGYDGSKPIELKDDELAAIMAIADKAVKEQAEATTDILVPKSRLLGYPDAASFNVTKEQREAALAFEAACSRVNAIETLEEFRDRMVDELNPGKLRTAPAPHLPNVPVAPPPHPGQPPAQEMGVRLLDTEPLAVIVPQGLPKASAPVEPVIPGARLSKPLAV